MNLAVRRQWFTQQSTAGQLAVNGQAECFTLEPVTLPEGSTVKPRAIPDGTYPLTIRWSWRFKKAVPHVESVPGFDAIEIHIGNYPKDTEACCCVGQTHPEPDFIGLSAVAWTALMAKLYAGATLTNPDSPEVNHIWNVGTITYSTVQ
jgi:hypothetical protein